MLNVVFTRGLNQLLADTAWARARLQPFSGRLAAIELASLRLRWRVLDDGYVGEEAFDAAVAPDVTLSLPLNALFQAPLGIAALMSQVQLQGNAEFAEAFGLVLRHLRWDAEETLSHWVGDIAAHRIGRLVTGVRTSQQQWQHNLQQNVSEYLRYEQDLVLSRDAFTPFATAVTAADQQLSALEARLAKLLAKI
jgi:ubiquinone biosynthesis protein UbiJ